MRPWRTNPTAARAWHLVTALIPLAALVIQFVLVLDGDNVLVHDGDEPPSTALRVANFFSYFTVQSNLLVIAGCLLLAADPWRDGRFFRVLRLTGLVGISVTGVVYATLLAPIVDLDGIAMATNVGFHYISPVMAVAGWLAFGPWPRFDARTVALSLVWPVAWLVYTLIRGEVVDWYPYPFIDVIELGYGRTLLNAAGVTVLLLGVGWLFTAGDRRLGVRAGSHPADDLPRAR
ncbi:Pr6Pr family membrane protein [Jiangella rhizosphaerae]|uniref:Pr6Pr family membrane protein n=1 Tax=Jiangella rhizosphaerae TaxID=2293569 RepID=UPI00131441D4|nr:Pr6Pr family membrane protein [Jiangella rhizosphaerae]